MTTSTTPVADRLLVASEQPAGDWRSLSWDAAPVVGAPWQPWEQVSLYGTALWEGLDEAARLELSRHEAASVLAAGIWSENTLMQMLLRVADTQDPRDARARYALTEVADECRHSLMFARQLDVLATPLYGPGRGARRLAALLARTAHPCEVFASALIVEEVLDAFQRAALRDPTVQPLTREVDRIHVVEEARHVSFARDELARRWAELGSGARAVLSLSIAASATVTVGSLVDPAVYAVVGIPPATGARAARTSPHRRELLRAATARLTQDFTDLGVINAGSRPFWHRLGLL